MLLIFFPLVVFNVALFICVCSIVNDVLVPWKKKKIWTSCTFLFFLLFVLNVTVFVYNRLKQNLILQTCCFYRILMFIFKKVVWDVCIFRLGYEFLAMFVTFVCISYFVSQICEEDIPHLTRKKKLTTFVYFLVYFELTWWYASF